MEATLSYVDVTFPTPFSSTGYKIAFTDYNSGITTTMTAPVNFCVASAYNTTSAFRVVTDRNGIGGFYWLAVGY